MHKEGKQSTWIEFAVFTVVLCFFFFSAQSIWKNPPRFNPGVPPRNEWKNELKKNEPRRAPAAKGENVNLYGATQTLNIGCVNKSQKTLLFESSANYLSVVAELCIQSDQKNFHSSRFRHETAQDEILAFFEPGASRIKTAYFPLHEGANKILFEMKSKKGLMHQQSLEILRSSKNK